MTLEPELAARLGFLARVVGRQRVHLADTDKRLFAIPFTPQRAASLMDDSDLAERVEAFVGRFARLQDTLGDKLLPMVLRALGEKTGAVIDNLDRAEKLGLIASADEWLVARQLRNQMVHEYVEDPTLLAEALQTGHAYVTMLIGNADALIAELRRRHWI